MIRTTIFVMCCALAAMCLLPAVVSLWQPIRIMPWNTAPDFLAIRCDSTSVLVNWSSRVERAGVNSGDVDLRPSPFFYTPGENLKWGPLSYRSTTFGGVKTLEWKWEGKSLHGLPVGGGTSVYEVQTLGFPLWMPLAVFAVYPLLTFIRGPLLPALVPVEACRTVHPEERRRVPHQE